MRYRPAWVGWRNANQTGLRSALPLRTRRTETFTISVPPGSRIVNRSPWLRTLVRLSRCVVRRPRTAKRLRAPAPATPAPAPAPARATPDPVRATLPLPPVALLAMLSTAGWAPAAVGAYWTVTAHDWPDGNAPAHVLAVTWYAAAPAPLRRGPVMLRVEAPAASGTPKLRTVIVF